MSAGKRQPARPKRGAPPRTGTRSTPPSRSGAARSTARGTAGKAQATAGKAQATTGKAPARGAVDRNPPTGRSGRTTRVGGSRTWDLDGRQVEGRQAVRELLLAGGRKVVDVWIVEDIEQSAIIEEITELAGDMRVPVRRVTRGALDAEARSDTPQGVLAHAAPITPVDFDDLCGRRALNGAAPFLLALDGVTDPQNLGAILRSGSCAGITGVVLPRHRAAHITPTVTKASAGAVEHVAMALVSGLPAALLRARELGVWTVGLDADSDVGLFDLEVGDEPVMLVVGAEGKGLSRLVRARCDVVVSIPLWGPISSLNVGVAGALACYEIARRR